MMKMGNSVSVNACVNLDLDSLGLMKRESALSRKQVNDVYMKLEEKIQAFAAIVDLVSKCCDETIHTQNFYYLLSSQENELNAVLQQLGKILD